MKVVSKKSVFEDERGNIIDILEDEVIEYVTIITSKKGAVRGDHYHKESVQYTFVLKGSLQLLTQMPGEEVRTTLLSTGDLGFSPPMEKHTLVAIEDSKLLILTRGPRGGNNYEKDTFRLAKSLTLNPALD